MQIPSNELLGIMNPTAIQLSHISMAKWGMEVEPLQASAAIDAS